jgi:lipopolysaccharide/colanic/teichoic acid biosynthesis glycosyltransferase
MSAGLYRSYIKRPLDVIFASAALVLFAPMMAIVAVVILVTMGHPVVFRQQRLGRGESVFTFFKFRTMSFATDRAGLLLPGAQRLTKTGRFLRISSLDELPQLWNILRGHMSFVGPRPLLVEYLPYFKPRERKRHDVRPGLTGLAQISGRNDLDWDQRFKFDVQYVEQHDFKLDAYIAFVTVGKVLRASNVSVPEYICPSLYDCRPKAAISETEIQAA